MIALIGLLLAQAPASDAKVWADTVQVAMDRWKICVVSTAREWSTQKAEPSEIADGALGHCAALQRDMEIALRSNTDLMPPDQAKQVVSEARTTWRERAIAAVLEKRSGTEPK